MEFSRKVNIETAVEKGWDTDVQPSVQDIFDYIKSCAEGHVDSYRAKKGWAIVLNHADPETLAFCISSWLTARPPRRA